MNIRHIYITVDIYLSVYMHNIPEHTDCYISGAFICMVSVFQAVITMSYVHSTTKSILQNWLPFLDLAEYDSVIVAIETALSLLCSIHINPLMDVSIILLGAKLNL